MDSLRQDLRYGIRLLMKRPGFTVIAIITLALGIGANTAIFSVVNAVLLRPLPYPEPERLVTLRSNQSLPDLDDIKSQSQAFEYFGGAVMQAQDYTGAAEPLQVQAALVNADLFKALGVQAAMGRTISDEEDRYGGEPVVVLSDAFWQQQFGADPDIIGKTIPLSGITYTIIGVMPSNFVMPRETPDVWAAVRVVNAVAAQFRGVHFLRTYFRLKPGVSMAQAYSDMENIDGWLQKQYPEENTNRRTELIPLHERVVGSTRSMLLILFGAVGLVLLIACANFANLLLARAAARQQEIVIRTALGAGRGRLVRQMITESVLLALAGGAGGLVLAMWGIDLLIALKPANLPRLSAVSIDLSVLAFTVGVSVLTGIVFGLAPALAATRLNMNESLKDGGRSSTEGRARQRLRSLLVISEIAIALVLLICAGLLIKCFWLLRSVETGFRTENILSMRVELPESRYKEIPKQTIFREDLLARLNSLPGAQAGIISELPLSGDQLTHNFIIEGRPPISPGAEPELMTRSVGGDYFRTMGIPLLQGRDFSAQDRSGAPMVGLVNESFAREYFPDESPIGARISWARGPRQWMTIIGVVGDVKHFGLDAPEQPAFYSSYAQLNQPWKRWMYLAVRSNADPAMLASEVKNQIWAIDKLIPVTRVQTMTEVLAASIAGRQFNMTLMGIFAGVALVLSAVGLYGVISYSVTQRTHEIGIRMALGAQGSDVLKMILRQGAMLAVTGVAIGLAAAFVATRVMASLLYGVSATDPLTFAVISLILAGVAVGACFVPARRATKVDPMVALRYE
jgi:putative ABC transport system permease protein